METNFKGTKGKCIIRGNYITSIENGTIVEHPSVNLTEDTKHLQEEFDANGELIVDAFNVRQQINCSLTELLGQRNELLEALQSLYQRMDSHFLCQKNDTIFLKAKKAIERTKTEQP